VARYSAGTPMPRSSRRLDALPGFSIDRIAAAAGDDADVLRLENLDTDLRPPASAIAATRAALERDDANSYLPFTGTLELRQAVAEHVLARSGVAYDPETEVVITCGGTEGLTDTLLAVTDPGDGVVVTDPTYAGIVNRVRLVGAEPRFAPWIAENGDWRLDVAALEAAAASARAMLLMSPSMPSGAVMSDDDWGAVAAASQRHDLWLIDDAAMEGILFDGRRLIHPAALPGMRERTLIVGSVAKELRMIGWRVGWVVGPAAAIGDVARAHIYNVVAPPGIAQAGAAAALRAPGDLAACVAEWQRRRDVLLDQMAGLPVVKPGGGWSLLLDTAAMGIDAVAAAELLLREARIAATPMHGWGATAQRWLRFVYSNEPVERLAEVGDRLRRCGWR
jgi:aspartate/methionine/tyrosine aminotransferase